MEVTTYLKYCWVSFQSRTSLSLKLKAVAWYASKSSNLYLLLASVYSTCLTIDCSILSTSFLSYVSAAKAKHHLAQSQKCLTSVYSGLQYGTYSCFLGTVTMAQNVARKCSSQTLVQAAAEEAVKQHMSESKILCPVLTTPY